MNEKAFAVLRAKGDVTALYRFAKGLPKGGLLHAHLSGAIPIDSILSDTEMGRFYAKWSEKGKEPKYSLMTGSEWNRHKHASRRQTLQGGVAPARFDKSFHEYRQVSSLSNEDRERLREALLFREVAPSSTQSVLGGADYKVTQTSLPKEFETRFQRIECITKDVTRTRKLLAVVLDSLWQDNVSYVELIVNPFDKVDPQKEAVRHVFGAKSAACAELSTALSQGDIPGFELLCAEHVLRRYVDEIHSFNSKLRRSHPTPPQGKARIIDARFLLGIRRDSLKRRERIRQCFDLVSRFAEHPAARYKNRVLGINLIGDEFATLGRPSDYLGSILPVITEKPRVVHISLHAGESGVDDGHGLDSVLLGAERLGHALSLQYSPRAQILVKRRRICIEACLLSNKYLGFQPNLEKHPAKEWLRQGFRVCLNTDDPGIFDTTLSDEFYYAIIAFNLSISEVWKLCETSLKSSFLPEPERTRAVDELRKRFWAFVRGF